MQQTKFLLIASSLATNYGLNSSGVSYPNLLRHAGMNFLFEQKNSLLISEASEIISKTDDLPKNLVIHLGTSVGWPRPIIKLGELKFKLHSNPYYFDLPAYQSKTQIGRFKSRMKIQLKRIIKSILFPLGLYRPMTTKSDTVIAIENLLEIVSKKFNRILWIQHMYLLDKKTKIEADIYLNYYNLIIKTISDANLTNLILATPGPDFLNARNYSLDRVHLSPEGHSKLASLISSWEQNNASDFEGARLIF